MNSVRVARQTSGFRRIAMYAIAGLLAVGLAACGGGGGAGSGASASIDQSSASIRRPGRAGLMANAPATRKNGVCEDAVLTLDRSTRSASLPQL